MVSYNMSQEEKTFLEQYDITKYERPSIATDVAIFSIMNEGENKNFRKLEKKALKAPGVLRVCLFSSCERM